MDRPTAAIVDFVQSLGHDDLSESCREAVKIRVLDTLACAWGAAEAEPAVISKRVLLRGVQTTMGPGMSRIITGECAPVDTAAFINSLMTRYLDYNDADYFAYGHPSDMILPIFNVAEDVGASGAATMLAIVAAYQVNYAISKGGGLNAANGWESSFSQSVGVAVAAAKLMELGPNAMADAIGIALACASPLNIRKSGAQISMWKGCGGPQAGRMGVLAAYFARDGMTGSHEAFEGARGVFEKVTGEFDARPYLQDRPGKLRIEESSLKMFPTGGNIAGPIEAALALRPEIGDLSSVEAIEIETYYVTWLWNKQEREYQAQTAEPWSPGTRETADHSLHWLVAVTLIDGEVNRSTFDQDKIGRSDVRDLLERMTITENPEFTSLWPDQWVNRLTIRMRDGRVLQKQVNFPLGEYRNPAGPEVRHQKVMDLMAPHLGETQTQAVIDRVGVLDEWADAGELFSFAARSENELAASS